MTFTRESPVGTPEGAPTYILVEHPDGIDAPGGPAMVLRGSGSENGADLVLAALIDEYSLHGWVLREDDGTDITWSFRVSGPKPDDKDDTWSPLYVQHGEYLGRSIANRADEKTGQPKRVLCIYVLDPYVLEHQVLLADAVPYRATAFS